MKELNFVGVINEVHPSSPTSLFMDEANHPTFIQNG
jgi:hypothetical protein